MYYKEERKAVEAKLIEDTGNAICGSTFKKDFDYAYKCVT